MLRAPFRVLLYLVVLLTFQSQADGPTTGDHIPFLSEGVRAIDLIDFDAQNTFWRTPKDTQNKLDPHSPEAIGSVVLKSIAELEQQR